MQTESACSGAVTVNQHRIMSFIHSPFCTRRTCFIVCMIVFCIFKTFLFAFFRDFQHCCDPLVSFFLIQFCHMNILFVYVFNSRYSIAFTFSQIMGDFIESDSERYNNHYIHVNSIEKPWFGRLNYCR